jgi:hypothetical protein
MAFASSPSSLPANRSCDSAEANSARGLAAARPARRQPVVSPLALLEKLKNRRTRS